MKIKVGIFFGGKSVESEISIISAIQTINAIDKNIYSVVPIYISKNGIWYTGDQLLDIENYQDMNRLLSSCKKILLSINSGENTVLNYPFSIIKKNIIDRIDVAFPVIHGTHGEDGSLQGLFELMDIPYVGSDVLASAIGMDKIVMKQILKEANFPIVNYTWFYSKAWLAKSKDIIEKIENKLKYPMIVKPANLGSSIGVKQVQNRNELEEAVDIARSFSTRVLVEEFIQNLKEVLCSVLGDFENSEYSVCEEPVRNSEILSFKDKYIAGDKSGNKAGGMSTAMRKVPADISGNMSIAIQNMAKQIFLLLNCHGVARIDFLIDSATNKIYANEINTIPGSLSFYLWEASGISFTELTSRLIKLALKRKREKDNLIFSYDVNILSNIKNIKGSKTKSTIF